MPQGVQAPGQSLQLAWSAPAGAPAQVAAWLQDDRLFPEEAQKGIWCSNKKLHLKEMPIALLKGV